MDTYKYKPVISLLARWEKINKYKHSKHCHYQQKHILLFVILVLGMLGREPRIVLYQLSQVMAEKKKEPLYQVGGWVNGRIAIAVVSSYSQIIHVCWLPSPLREREPDWDPESGIRLAG